MELSLIYAGIVICIAVNAGIYFKQHSDYVTKREETQQKIDAARELLEKAQVEQNNLGNQKNELKRRVEIKKKEDEKRQKESEQTIEILNKTLVNLPPIDVWPELIKKIEILATDLKIKIANFTIIEKKDLEGKLKQDFTEFYFTLDIEGEYSKILEYLWNLENAIQLRRDDNASITWKAIIKIEDGGFVIKDLMTPDDTMKLQLTLTTFFRGSQ